MARIRISSSTIIIFAIYFSKCISATPPPHKNVVKNDRNAGSSNKLPELSLLEEKIFRTLLGEVFTVGCGFHTKAFAKNFSHTADTEKQLIAIAFLNLVKKLSVVVDIDKEFLKSTRTLASKNVTSTSTFTSEGIYIGISGDEMLRIFKNIESALLANATLAPLYNQEKMKAKKLNLSPLDYGVDDRLARSALLQKYPRCRENWLVTLIIRDRNRPINCPLVIARGAADIISRAAILPHTLVSLARSSKANRVQEIFDNFVRSTAEKLAKTPEDSLTPLIYETFAKLEEKLKKDPELGAKFTATQDTLIKRCMNESKLSH